MVVTQAKFIRTVAFLNIVSTMETRYFVVAVRDCLMQNILFAVHHP
jgi:hypothetical protein